jgi:hypothetical protein
MGLGLPEDTEHEAFLKQVQEGRIVIRLRAERVYGMALDLPPEMREL